MAFVEDYKGYRIEAGLSGGHYDSYGNLVGQANAYRVVKPDGSRTVSQPTLADARGYIDTQTLSCTDMPRYQVRVSNG
ncbi:hypothetical protein [Pseudomonas fluorescens]|uniref:hypothetical protein n=1 Tax=Pseudomonas fluorescens TaxID=294 RepID=UPI00263F87DE|nr:hypothetical protein [Pseudomonas fluorescens]UEL25179.1 hypothetical protein K6106_07090 [Pseudomonas fluorescens]WLH75893.1 hypothetical protein PSH70_10615 [Pseudomonas fluorescens]